MYILLFLILFGVATPIFPAYIDTRDLGQDQNKIQRLLGKLDAMKVIPMQNNQQGITGGQLALLTMMTTGLSLAAVSSSHNNYYRYDSYYGRPKPYPKYLRKTYNNVATAIGATVATAGLLGLIGSEIAKDSAQQNNDKQIKEINKIQLEINSIISNLVATDEDFIAEIDKHTIQLTSSTERNIKRISDMMTNELQRLDKKLEKKQNEFITLTNKLMTNLQKQEKSTYEAIAYNIHKMSDQKLTKDIIKELESLNKTLEKRFKKEQKIVKTQIKNEIKRFDKAWKNLEMQNIEGQQAIKSKYGEQIVKIIEDVDLKKENIFQKYITRYIQKLSVY